MSSRKTTNLYEEKNKIEAGTLYLVATPIGNLSDLSERAVKVLREVDFIAAEDTRNSVRMLTYLGIKKPLVSYFEHNKAARGDLLCERLAAGESCALITDAGTPAISDPGEDIVRLCAERGIPVTSIPGPCAAIVSLTLSALPTGRFTFEGFLSTDKAERRDRLLSLREEERTMIFHEAPHKLKRTLSDFVEAFGNSRRIALCRELTKKNEEVMRVTIAQAVRYYEENEPRGEYVLVVEGIQRAKTTDASVEGSALSLREEVLQKMAQGISKMDAIKQVAHAHGLAKNEVYQEMLKENDEHA